MKFSRVTFPLVAVAWLAISGGLPAVEPAAPVMVVEWVEALEKNHPTLRNATTPGVMLGLAKSPMLRKVGEILVRPVLDDRDRARRGVAVHAIGMALSELARLGYLEEAAKIDEVVYGESPRVAASSSETLAAAARLRAAGKREALLRLAETMLLVPGCDRQETFDVEREQRLSARSMEVPGMDAVSVPRAITVLVLLERHDLLGQFRAKAERRLVLAPTDFKTLQALTLASLLDVGDSPELWDRFAAAAPERSGRRTPAVWDMAEFAYQMQIPAPHFCERAEGIIEQAGIVDVRYGDGHSHSVGFRLLLAALWKDAGRLDRARSIHGEILDALAKQEPAHWEGLFEHRNGLLVDALNDPVLAEVLDRWIRGLVAAEQAEKSLHASSLDALTRALALGADPVVLGKWVELADAVLANSLDASYGDPRLLPSVFQRHIGLLLDAGMIERANDWQARISRLFQHVPRDGSRPDAAIIRSWIDHAVKDRELLLWKRPPQELVACRRWQEGGTRRGESPVQGVFVADLFPEPAEPFSGTVTYDEGTSPAKRLAAGGTMRAVGGLLTTPLPDGQSEPWLSVTVARSKDRIWKSDPQPLPPHPNLLGDDWLLCDEHGPVSNLARVEQRQGSLRLGYRGATAKGERLRLLSGPIQLEPGVNHVFSGRIRARGTNGRVTVALEFLDAEGRMLGGRSIAGQVVGDFPGDRFFRVVLRRGKEPGVKLLVPPEAESIRVVLGATLAIEAEWADLMLCRLELADPAGFEPAVDDRAEPWLEFGHPVAALATGPLNRDRLAVALPQGEKLLLYHMKDLSNPTVYQIPPRSQVHWMALGHDDTLVVLLGRNDGPPRSFRVFRPGKPAFAAEAESAASRPALAKDGDRLLWLELADAGGNREVVLHACALDGEEHGILKRPLDPEAIVIALQMPWAHRLWVRGRDWRTMLSFPELEEVRTEPCERQVGGSRFDGIEDFLFDPGLHSASRLRPFGDAIVRINSGRTRVLATLHDRGRARLVSRNYLSGRSIGSMFLQELIRIGLLVEVKPHAGCDLLYVRASEANRIYRLDHFKLSNAGLLK